ncbi:MAG: DUF2298 domain-containing protein [Candidatus Promineifilaceae bacterium]
MLIGDIAAAFRWWVALLFLGAAATPLTISLLHRLPDRGYALVKIVGLLIVSYFFWLLGSLGFLQNDFGGILVGALVLILLSVWSLRQMNRQGRPFGAWFSSHWRYALVVEALFLVIFIIWVWVRAQNPAITATEKPMEFAFLNSAGRSATYPPLDPWLSGFAISYYYFGYVMMSVLGRLAAVAEPIGFNLGIAWLVAGTAVGAFGLVYNLVAAGQKQAGRLALVLGLAAAVALPIAGNLEIVLEILHSRGVGSDQVWAWLDVRDLNGPAIVAETPRYETSQWWWWRSSRVIHEYHLSGRPEEGLEPIAEFPGFSFVLGDLHPHVLALPFAFLSLAAAFAWWLEPESPVLDVRRWTTRSGLRDQLIGLRSHRPDLTLFTILILGGLSFLNTWDVLIHLSIVLGAIVLASWRRVGHWQKDFLAQALTFGLVLAVAAVISYLPFYIGFRSQAGPPFLLPMTMRPTRLVHLIVIFGLPWLGIVALLVTLALDYSRRPAPRDVGPAPNGVRPWRIGLALAAGVVAGLFLLMLLLGWVIAAAPQGAGQIISLANELDLTLPEGAQSASIFIRMIWAVRAIAILLPSFVAERLTYPVATVVLFLMLASVVMLLIRQLTSSSPQDISPVLGSQSLPFVLLLIGAGILLVLGPEFVYLKDNFGQRINTVFKFYYQAWVLFGLSALFGLGYLIRNYRVVGGVVTVLYAATLVASLLFPRYAIASRAAEYRGSATAESREPATLDGLAYLERYGADDQEAILWLRENIAGSPVILEAVGGQYTAYGRVSAGTGLPTILGWPGHEYQWRGDTPEPARREAAVAEIYSEVDWQTTARLLDQYNVRLIYLGPLEKSTYDPRAELKFDEHLDVAYQNGGVKIYRWQPVDSSQG